MGKLSRTKGSTAEREVANEIEGLTGIKLRRNLSQYQSVGGYDLEPDPNQPLEQFAMVSSLAIECKRYATVTDASIRRWWAETQDEAAMAGKIPVLIYRGDRQEWKAKLSGQNLADFDYLKDGLTVSLFDFCCLIREGAIKPYGHF